MSFIDLLFFMFASMATVLALGVVFLKEQVSAAVCLVITFLAMFPIWLMLGAEFLSLSLVLVYVGAVLVLFLFVLMMIDFHKTIALSGLNLWTIAAIILTSGIMGLFYTELIRVEQQIHYSDENNVIALAKIIFSRPY